MAFAKIKSFKPERATGDYQSTYVNNSVLVSNLHVHPTQNTHVGP